MLFISSLANHGRSLYLLAGACSGQEIFYIQIKITVLVLYSMDINAESQVKALCDKLKIPSPVEFLTQIMGGTDPRRVSQVYLKVLALEEEYEGAAPDDWDWQELVDLIKAEYRGSIVEIGKSQDAAKQLMEYMHPKRKAIEVSQKGKAEVTGKLSRLEIKRLRKEFDLDY